MSSSQQEQPDIVHVLSESLDSSSENVSAIVSLEDYSEELTLDPNEIETDDSELIVASQDVEHEEEIIQSEEDPDEIEIQSEDRKNLPIGPSEKKFKATTGIPPLRLLNIAPKPEQVPLTVKSVNGQPVLLVPGTSGAQTIKLVNPQGQEINLANYSLSRPITVKSSGKVALPTTSIIQQQQPKQIFMKKIITTSGQKTITKPVNVNKVPQQFVVVQKAGDQPQQIKLIQSSGSTTVASVPNKTLTLQQAQEMGLFGNAKIIQSGRVQQVSGKRTVLINKAQPKAIKLVQQTAANQGNIKTISLGQIKSPTKILPAGVLGVKGTQKIIFKSSNGNQVLPAGQLIQVAGSQGLANGQIHQINVPGKGVQYIKFVASTSAEASSTTVSLTNTLKTTTTTTGSVTDLKPVLSTNLITKPITTTTTKPTQVMLVPAGYIPTAVQQVQKVQIPPAKPPNHPKPTLPSTNRPIAPAKSETPEPTVGSPTANTPSVATTEAQTNIGNNANGIRPRKPCNCTKSQCLKLYCDCFANGEFCYLCNCMNCFNNLENEDTRNLAIKACLERNPNAFRPKIGKAKDTTGDFLRKHTKGCNCKRSGCLKNYCECYEAKIACSSNCKCIGCRNIEDAIERKNLELNSNTHRINNNDLAGSVFKSISPYFNDSSPLITYRSKKSGSLRKQPITYITDEVIEATCQCLLTISDNADTNMQDEELTKRQIIEEFGGCLNEIIHCSLKRNVT